MTQREVPAAAPDSGCLHEDFDAEVRVARLTRSDDDPTVIAYKATITVVCTGCGEKFLWLGPEVGDMPDRPMLSVDGTELRAAIAPRGWISADVLPGFHVQAHVYDEERLHG